MRLTRIAWLSLVLCTPCASLAEPDFDVTVQVLDEVEDVRGVLANVEQAHRAADRGRAGRQGTRVSDGDAPSYSTRGASRADPAFELDREEESEGELEDFDVPSDVEVLIEDES